MIPHRPPLPRAFSWRDLCREGLATATVAIAGFLFALWFIVEMAS